MEQDQRVNGVCRGCGCSQAQAAADAKAVGLEDEFQAGEYTCCQVVQWADEQWLAWREAAMSDGKAPEDATRLLEIEESELFVPVHVRRRQDSHSGDPSSGNIE
jgi:hypothetical protein